MPQNIKLLQHESSRVSGKAELIVDASIQSPYTISPFLYGKFCEHLGSNIYHGMEAQILFNCTFGKWYFSAGDDHPDGGVREESDRGRITSRIEARAVRMGWSSATPVIEAFFDGGAYGWFRVGTKDDVRLSPDVGRYGGRAQRVEVMTESKNCGIGQLTYLPLHRTQRFEYRIVARSSEPVSITLGIAPANNIEKAVYTDISIGCDWETTVGHINLPDDFDPSGLYQFSITANKFANIVLDRVLLYPDDHINGADPDVIDMLKDSNLPLLRWPGGNFVSGYHWHNGIGPIDSRLTIPNPAWEGLEFNLFGTDEFISFCQAVGCEPMICVNTGDGTPEEAREWVEYCNGSISTPMGRLRADNGHPEPYNIKYWEIGNEIYGRWQVKWTTNDGNLDRYRCFSKAMLKADPSIQLLGCGFGNEPNSEWNYRLIDGTGKSLRSITDHILTGGAVNSETDPAELYHAFMGYAVELEKRYNKLRDRMNMAGINNPRMAITELQLFAHFHGEVRPDGKLTPNMIPRPDTIAEALFHATIVNTCIRLGDFVELLTHSATVNHGGGLRKERERVYANPIHLANKMATMLAGCTPIPIRLKCETFSTQHAFAHIPPLDEIPVIDAMSALSPEGNIILMLIHRGANFGDIELTVQLDGFKAQDESEIMVLAGETWYDRNTLEEPDKISLQQSKTSVINNNQIILTLPPYSLTRVVVKTH